MECEGCSFTLYVSVVVVVVVVVVVGYTAHP
jgi:hypothetical protein